MLNKLRQFQLLGHNVIFLIGDFTALIGDPTGKNALRKPLTETEIKKNIETYTEQVFKILDPKLTRIEHNSKWMAEMKSSKFLDLASKLTVARMLEREDFGFRFHSQKAIFIHEFLYPLMQGYDSVILKADVELGGSDQKFNLLMGRELQRDSNQNPQSILMMPLLEGLDGKKKMSKSLNNFISLKDSPGEMFGKIMSISDSLMWRYLDLLSFKSTEEIINIKADTESAVLSVQAVKAELANELISRFYDKETANRASRISGNRFKPGEIPDEMREYQIQPKSPDSLPLFVALREIGLVSSSSEGRKKIEQNAVRINGELVSDPNRRITTGETSVIQCGKRNFVRLTVLDF